MVGSQSTVLLLLLHCDPVNTIELAIVDTVIQVDKSKDFLR